MDFRSVSIVSDIGAQKCEENCKSVAQFIAIYIWVGYDRVVGSGSYPVPEPDPNPTRDFRVVPEPDRSPNGDQCRRVQSYTSRADLQIPTRYRFE